MQFKPFFSVALLLLTATTKVSAQNRIFGPGGIFSFFGSGSGNSPPIPVPRPSPVYRHPTTRPVHLRPRPTPVQRPQQYFSQYYQRPQQPYFAPRPQSYYIPPQQDSSQFGAGGGGGAFGGICLQPRETGPCRAAFPAWYYDARAQECRHFTYGGCGGNDNNFSSRAACERACG